MFNKLICATFGHLFPLKVKKSGKGLLRKVPVKEKIATVGGLITALNAATKLYNTGKQYYQMYEAANSYTISINESDSLYEAGQQWILDNAPEKDQRDLYLFIKDKALMVQSLSSKTYSTDLNGHKIKFYVEIPEGASKASDSATYTELSKQYRPKILKFSSRTEAGKQEILSMLHEIADSVIRGENPAYVKSYNWSMWNTAKKLPERTLDSVVLEESKLDRVVNDLDNFLSSKEKYDSVGLPWHRGYLFHGPPGTGKTSLSIALARHLNKSLHVMNLGDVKTDELLTRMVTEVTDGILLIEDIDVFASTVNSREKEEGSASLAGLLNALDGVATPDGLITIMTTNDITKLNPAILRSGRVDVIEKLDYLSSAQLQTLFKRMFNEPLGEMELQVDVAPCEIVEIYKRTTDPAEARVLVKEKLQGE